MTPSSCAAGSSGGWTDDAVETLVRLWRQGDLSAAMIGRRLGVTRNAVLGKIHRLGLSQPRRPRPPAIAPPPRPAKPRPVASARRASASAPVRMSPQPTAEIAQGLVARLEDLPTQACHWPLGDPQAADFAFCGRRAETRPYCPAHAGMAYRGRGVDVAELARLLRR
ncbi:GcrA family cell cycle regulator [Phenylobacterium kunshanense]|uniref:GcrA cell cycle regulator n=1 Tax=Phenylobacterium kunshanense TaxID=1445034 RepID=A0A328BRT4_9CAUL|nr:GcrA family cell cycle regulator [Phenylobacterium kunshanense]RAK68716.1 GcrA cell cycle regulator [Phenylobacterium kunshanense]